MQVLVRDNNVDQALKALKKKMQREGIFREMKLRGHYEKPSEKRAREKAEAVRRARKLARKKLQREGLLPMKPKPTPGAGPARAAEGDSIGNMGRGSPPLTISPFFSRMRCGERRDLRSARRAAGGGWRIMRMTARSPSRGGRAMDARCRWRRWRSGPAARLSARFRPQTSRVAEVDTDTSGANAGNIASLSDVIQRNPNDSVAYNTRGIAYAKSGRYQNAIDDFTKAIQIDPKFAAAYTNRALAYRQIGKDGPALADFNAAIVANPNDASAYLGRGNLLRAHSHFPEALADLDAAIRLNPEGAQAYHARGLIYQRQGDHEQAITDFNNAIDRDPFAGAPYQARGQSLLATGKYDAAVEDFNAALNVDPNNADAWAGLGLAYEKQGDKPKAVESLPARDAGEPQQRDRPRRAAKAGVRGGLWAPAIGGQAAL